MKGLFILAYSWYEDYSPYYFEGPESSSQKDFESLCDSLLEKAGSGALLKEQRDKHPSFVGWHCVVESMIPLLEQQGYRHFKPTVKTYFGGNIIDCYEDAEKLGKSGQPIATHNAKIKEGMFDRHRTKK